MKKIFLTLFTFITVSLNAQKASKFILSNIDGFNIKISQLNDTAVKLIIPREVDKNCRTIVYLHGGGFLQTISMQTNNGGFKFYLLSNEMKRKLSAGGKITFEAVCTNDKGKWRANPFYTSTYTVIAD